jgi:DNA-binding transcriptional LysR family regulator
VSELLGSIELKPLLAIRAVAKTGTFWQAAELLQSSHSTISDQIAALERATGQHLVVRSRGRRTVHLTDAGNLLVDHAVAIEARLRALDADLRALARGEAGIVRVGIYQSLANRMLPEVMRKFSAAWPGVELQVVEVLDDPQLIAGIECGSLDVCFDVLPVPQGPFRTHSLARDPFVAVSAKTSALAGRRVTTDDLATIPLVAYLPSRTFDLVEAYLATAGVDPHIVYRSNDNATVQAMVAAGLGIAVMPLLSVRQHDPHLLILDLDEPIPPRVIVAVTHQYRAEKPAIRALVDIARSALIGIGQVS